MLSYFDSPFGRMELEVTDERLVNCRWSLCRSCPEITEQDCSNIEIDVMNDVKRQLDEYFHGVRTQFDIRFAVTGSPFYVKVWTELLKIPYGSVVSYKEVARRMSLPNGQRAVAQACSNNHLCIIVPCHRVISSSYSIGGYTTSLCGEKKGSQPQGLSIKQNLLDLENAVYRLF